MNNKSKKEEIIAGALRVTKNFAPALTSAFQQIGWISPEFALLSGSVLSIVGYYGDYANDRTLDFLKQFAKNKEYLVDEIVQSDKFKAVFIKTIGDNITESNEEKRQLLKNYVLNFACGIEPEFNEHTKLLSTLDTITMDELSLLKLWEDGGMMQGDNSYGKVGRTTVNDIKRIVLKTRKAGESEVGDYEKHILKLVENKDSGNKILLSLGYKGLLYVLGENNFGSGEEAKVSDITDFGKTFLTFIKS
jgi:hypothetical protein